MNPCNKQPYSLCRTNGDPLPIHINGINLHLHFRSNLNKYSSNNMRNHSNLWKALPKVPDMAKSRLFGANVKKSSKIGDVCNTTNDLLSNMERVEFQYFALKREQSDFIPSDRTTKEGGGTVFGEEVNRSNTSFSSSDSG